jgi:predicted flap endonuclease-1-like 5' DNA nuclease
MLDILNPCNDPNAWWQQLLMLAGPLFLGYFWAKGGKSSNDGGLSARLSALDADLMACKSKAQSAEAALKTILSASNNSGSVTANAISGSDGTLIGSNTGVITGNEIANTAANDTSMAANSLSSNSTSSAFSNTSKSKKDDLKVVEGIGPKIESLFNEAGINTFGELANASADRLKEILVAAGSRYQMHDPTTWPAQSKLAEEGKWEELKKWQDELNKGTE